jgi:uncharacterized glyoxalase superfamily protein PhnB
VKAIRFAFTFVLARQYIAVLCIDVQDIPKELVAASSTPLVLADAHQATEVLTALQLDSREAVDRFAERALATGGAAVRAAEDHGFMYARAFADPDGHIWEPFWMDPAAMEAGK